MPPEKSSAGPDDELDGESEATEADAVETTRPRDPMIVLLRTVEHLLRGLDRLHARLEALPGRVRFGFGVLTFVTSAYFGTTVRWLVDSLVGRPLATLVTEFMSFSSGVRVLLVLVTLVVVQLVAANGKLITIGEIVENMADDEAVTDGGVRTRPIEKTGAWARGGATLGAGFGALFGYATILGGLIFGAIVGDLAEEWSAKLRKRRRLRVEVVEYLLRERVFEPDAVERDTVHSWFPVDDEEFVFEAVEELIRSDDAPVTRTVDGIYLVGASEAVAYLDRNDGRVPSAFAGPNRPPRPSDASE